MIILKLKELLQKFKINLTLHENLLNLEIEGEYKDMVKTRIWLDSFTKQGLIKQEYDTYKFSGDNCECFITPSNMIRTVSIYYKKENFSYGYSFDDEGMLSSRV